MAKLMRETMRKPKHGHLKEWTFQSETILTYFDPKSHGKQLNKKVSFFVRVSQVSTQMSGPGARVDVAVVPAGNWSKSSTKWKNETACIFVHYLSM